MATTNHPKQTDDKVLLRTNAKKPKAHRRRRSSSDSVASLAIATNSEAFGQATTSSTSGLLSRPTNNDTRSQPVKHVNGRHVGASSPLPTTEVDDLANSLDPSLERRNDSRSAQMPGKPKDNAISSTSYSWPILIAVMPSMGALFWGTSEIWGDFLFLLLITYFVYNCIRAPWELYYSAKRRRSIAYDLQADGKATESQQNASRKLARQQFWSFAFVLVSPFIAGYVLVWTRTFLSVAEKYFSDRNINLFIFAASIRPFTHTISLLKQRASDLQLQIHYPSAEIERLREDMESLQKDVKLLRKAFATKEDIGQLNEDFAPAFEEFQRALRRCEEKEHLLRVYSNDRFQNIEARMKEVEHFKTARLESENRSSSPLALTTFFFLPVNITIWALRYMGRILPSSRPIAYHNARPSLTSSEYARY